MNKVMVLYHADADGFGAAYALWKIYGPDADYLPVQYSQPVPTIPPGIEEMFIVDFSYDRDTCQDLASRYKLTILDHHRTAAQALAGLPYAVFDMGKSGCRLSWEMVMGMHTPLPDILQYVEDYDLWRFTLPLSEAVNLAIECMPRDFETWESFNLIEATTSGLAIKRFRDRQIATTVKNVQLMTIDGHENVPVVNTNLNVSEVGHALLDAYPAAPFASIYSCRGGVMVTSLRSRPGRVDVSAIAKKFGGGGHRHAAGFTMTAC